MGYKRKPIPKKTRELVWNKYGHKCAYCGCDLEYKDMQVDHVYSVAYAHWNKEKREDLDDISNLMPSCRMCNFYKGVSDIERFRKHLLETLCKTAVASFQTRLAIKYGMVVVQEWDGKFWFEKFEETPQQ